MATKRRPETLAKRARELAVKERRDRKRARREEAAAQRAAGPEPMGGVDGPAAAEPEAHAPG